MGHRGWDGSCRGGVGVSYVGVGWDIQGWGGSCMVGWRGSCRGRVG